MVSIHGYELITPMTDQNAGMSQWCYAKKNGKDYFLKRYMVHYPFNEDDTPMNQKVKKECLLMEKKYAAFYKKINDCAKGHVVRVEEYFRSGSDYYITMERIFSVDESFEDLQKRPLKERLLLCKTLAYGVMCLHEHGIVHADLKKENILLVKTKNNHLATKIIDYDEGFLESNPPNDPDALCGDPVYFAPESLLFINGETDSVNAKIDIFAMGLIMHQYLTGELPSFSKEYSYPCEVIANNGKLEVSRSLGRPYRTIIEKMLTKDPNDRYNARQVLEKLNNPSFFYIPNNTVQANCQ